jgi:hypothetical protein
VSVRFAVQHALAAAMFSRRVGEIERENTGRPANAFFGEIIQFSFACVVSAVATLEAYVNEIYTDRDSNFPTIGPKLMTMLWEFIELKSVLEKFNYALVILGKTEFDKGAKLYQDADTLRRLRDALVHFKPGQDDESQQHANLSARLEKTGFSRSPFCTPADPFFPRAWTTHEGTEWAVTTALKFANDFAGRAGLPPRFDLSAPELQP